jgi:hypothetical protein
MLQCPGSPRQGWTSAREQACLVACSKQGARLRKTVVHKQRISKELLWYATLASRLASPLRRKQQIIKSTHRQRDWQA